MLLTAAQARAQLAVSDVLCEDTCRHIHGIDLSHYQGNVFWEEVGRNMKINYVYLKATEGATNIDDRYEENIRMAKLNGLYVGSYHYFRPATPLKEQFDNFVTQCRPEQQDLIPMIDIETRGGLSTDAFIDSLTTFLAMVEDYYRAKPLIYTGANFYDHNLSGGLLDEYKLMIAQYTDYEPVLIDERNITIWQYTGKGRIRGVSGNIDKSRLTGNHRLREIRYLRQ
ncbi:MAG: glycoside hydrolase family 25 protein [Prevotella sp.]|nr:glycoside hydrolase family 25 protein [Prevotella sp.]